MHTKLKKGLVFTSLLATGATVGYLVNKNEQLKKEIVQENDNENICTTFAEKLVANYDKKIEEEHNQRHL